MNMFDIRFRFFGIPVLISFWYWITLLLFAWIFGFVNRGWEIVIAFILANFLAEFAKGFGEAIVAKLYGYQGALVFEGMDGGATGDYQTAKGMRRSNIAIAGPATGFLVYAGCYFSLNYVTGHLLPRMPLNLQFPTIAFIGYLMVFTLYFGLLHLFPVLNYAGGIIMREGLIGVIGRSGERLAYLVSFVVAAAVAGYSGYKIAHPEVPYLDELLMKPFLNRAMGQMRGEFPLFTLVIFAWMALSNLWKFVKPWFGRRGDHEGGSE